MGAGDMGVGAANPGMRKVQYRRTWVAGSVIQSALETHANLTVRQHPTHIT
jgi:hypothetical protein